MEMAVIIATIMHFEVRLNQNRSTAHELQSKANNLLASRQFLKLAKVISLCLLLFSVKAFACVHPNRATYVKSEGVLLSKHPQAFLEHLTLPECASVCTQDAQCSAFQYVPSRLRCILSDSADGHPSEFTPMLPSDYSLYEKICIETSFNCPSPHAFERFAGHVLIGNALEVTYAENLSKCLAGCLEAAKVFQIECSYDFRSVMYYYTTKECIMNREDRSSLPNLFVLNDLDRSIVDYFDNKCLNVACQDGWSVHWIKIQPFEISNHSDLIIEGISKDECLIHCLVCKFILREHNSINDQQFPCKLFTYSDTTSTCHLTTESGMIRREKATQMVRRFEGTEPEIFYEKICLQTNKECGNVSFEQNLGRVPRNVVKSEVIPTLSVSECLELCLQRNSRCNGAIFSRNKVDHYVNVCEYVTREQFFDDIHESPSLHLWSDSKPVEIPERAYDSKRITVQHSALSSHEHSVSQQNAKKWIIFEFSKQIPFFAVLQTECNVNSIIVRMRFSSKKTGSIFIKDHFSTCHANFENSSEAVLKIELPSLHDDNPSCPAHEIKPSKWSFVIVVHRNDSEKSALVVDLDRVFNISCDYSNAVMNSNMPTKIQPSAEEMNQIQPMEAHSRPGQIIEMTILRGGQPVSSVMLGEEVEIRWTTVRGDDGSDKFDFKVTECSAERLDGTAPNPPPLQLISNGCPNRESVYRLILHQIKEIENGYSTTMKVFKFDGSRRVRIICTVDICDGDCDKVRGCTSLIENIQQSVG
ncbi:unnamed protein product [Anisakis simplex]|uniref:PAN domain protein n=1 Tax=Anisakis simplex TaxID=6269 RepID=A0A0M3K2C6_ANISI|nr:unnamed protein product [Anisakis simplex]